VTHNRSFISTDKLKKMCILFLSLKAHPQYPFILASNRDEHKLRPTRTAHFWEDEGNEMIYAARDEVAGGTWLGVTKTGRLATLTNRWDIEPHFENGVAPSRGLLVSNALKAHNFEEFSKWIQGNGAEFNGFNLIYGQLTRSSQTIYYYNNHDSSNTFPIQLTPGVYALSNASLETPWPKLVYGKDKFSTILKREDLVLNEEDLVNALLNDLLRDAIPQAAHNLQKAGTNSIFVPDIITDQEELGPYGTRTNTIILMNNGGLLRHIELAFLVNGSAMDGITPGESYLKGEWKRTDTTFQLAFE